MRVSQQRLWEFTVNVVWMMENTPLCQFLWGALIELKVVLEKTHPLSLLVSLE